MIHFGLSFSPSENFQDLKRKWQYFERRTMVDSLWLSDHLIRTFKPESPYRDAWSLLPALGAVTETAKIGTLVTCNTFRHPSVLVRQIQTVDEVTNGRLIIGMGAGWYKPEHGILGIPFPKHPIRALESSIHIILSMLRSGHVEFLNTPDYLPIRDAIIRPKPIGPLPLLIGGHGPRMLDLTARLGNIWNSFGTPREMAERNYQLDALLLMYGRMPSSVERTIHIWRGLTPVDPWTSVQAFRDTMGAYADCGLTGFILDAPRDGQQMRVFEKC